MSDRFKDIALFLGLDASTDFYSYDGLSELLEGLRRLHDTGNITHMSINPLTSPVECLIFATTIPDKDNPARGSGETIAEAVCEAVVGLMDIGIRQTEDGSVYEGLRGLCCAKGLAHTGRG